MNFKHVLVPYTGTDEEQDLLRTVCEMCRAMKARLSVVYVLEVPMTLPVDADVLPGIDEANSILDQAEDIARSVHMKVASDLLQARDAGHAIVEEAAQRGVDLVLMEASQAHQAGMLRLGRTVEYVLKHALCNVWISRHTSGSVKDNRLAH